MAISTQADFFLNFQNFSDLKLKARGDSDEAARAVAQQFEGLFVQQMLSAMRAAAEVDAGQNSSYMDFYRDMYDKQLAQTIAQQDRLGVSRLILQQMPGGADNTAATAPAAVETDGVEVASVITQAAPVASVKAEPDPVATNSAVVLSRVVDNDFAEVAKIDQMNNRWQQPQNFIADIWPEAQNAARELGVRAELLVAQAALETGWGKHMMKFDDGRNSFNLFGIKAGPDWRGSALNKASLEYRDGLLSNEVSRFRAYASPAASLADYVDFIRTSPRYQPALNSAGDAHAYIRAIHQAGYATDPNYADKVIGIMDGALLGQALAGLDQGVTSYG